MSVTDIAGVRVGHWTDTEARTGCTVVLLPEGTVASGEVRGGAPATREFALLAPENLVDRVDAVVLSGGSAFGLAAADGVMRWLEEKGIGFETRAGPVPIVVGLALYDLHVGDSSVRPGADQGYAAAVDASTQADDSGPIGAGTGATHGKWGGADPSPGGLASASVTALVEDDDGAEHELIVSALVAVNAMGFIGEVEHDLATDPRPIVLDRGNTTIGVVVTNAELSKLDCFRLAQGAHDGMARAIMPPHTLFDGDALVAAASGQVDAHPEMVRAMAVIAVEQAIGDLAP
jgi:L-aminopeptidase/D-esterase-like protein